MNSRKWTRDAPAVKLTWMAVLWMSGGVVGLFVMFEPPYGGGGLPRPAWAMLPWILAFFIVAILDACDAVALARQMALGTEAPFHVWASPEGVMVEQARWRKARLQLVITVLLVGTLWSAWLTYDGDPVMPFLTLLMLVPLLISLLRQWREGVLRLTEHGLTQWFGLRITTVDWDDVADIRWGHREGEEPWIPIISAAALMPSAREVVIDLKPGRVVEVTKSPFALWRRSFVTDAPRVQSSPMDEPADVLAAALHDLWSDEHARAALGSAAGVQIVTEALTRAGGRTR